jgi:hypothetical protein
MPTKRTRRRASRRANAVTSESVRLMLLTGVYFYFLDPAPAREDTPPSDDVLRAAWELLREELIAEHVAAEPGTRPWAWWRFDASEQRRLVAGDHETEVAYLRRLNLLTADEERTLNRVA